ncbi:MAG: dihydroorotase [Planctomycetota bacterium]
MLTLSNVPALWIRGGRVLDPFTNRDEIADVFISNGVIARHPEPNAIVIRAEGCILCPGMMDLHVHLREPGSLHKETIETGTRAAAAGGFTFVACMPNTAPAIDSPDIVQWIIRRAQDVGACDVGPVAAITVGREGKTLTDFAALQEAGAVAFSDDGVGVEDDRVMLEAFQRACGLKAILIQHCEFKALAAGGIMHLGEHSKKLNLPGIDPRAEEAMIERDIDLCRKTGARYHVAHISTAIAVDLVRHAKAQGIPVTAEVTPHHLILTDEACLTLDPNAKMHPPLRTWKDVMACRQGLVDGTIDCIATDHAPHAADEKAKGFLLAPPGLIGLETAVGVVRKAMLESELAGWPDFVKWFTKGPSTVLNLRRNTLEEGQAAELTLIEPECKWLVNKDLSESKSRNTPFDGWELAGRGVATVRGTKFAADFTASNWYDRCLLLE